MVRNYDNPEEAVQWPSGFAAVLGLLGLAHAEVHRPWAVAMPTAMLA